MDFALLLEYGWVLLILVGLEGILAADNAVVMAVMVKHLPPEQQKKALFYGLFGAFIFRFASLFLISVLVDVWQVQALGAIYLLYICIHNLYGKFSPKEKQEKEKERKKSGFWMTVLKVELADIAFAIDSMLAAVALAITLTPTGWFDIGGIDGGQFTIMLLGGIIGLVIMRFAANSFVKLLQTRPSLETAAFLIVGWVGVKLAVFTLAHPEVGLLDQHFPESKVWKFFFWSVLLIIAVGGYIISGRKAQKTVEDN
ncbi:MULTISPECIES: TerC family protein [Bacillaceae]|uniref:TerC family protein n=1 Tax=Bacillaceae TaxID=186817 RepID=UPI001E61AEB6|nr:MULTISPECIES: TerC family protein [Bacillaceae]MCE4048505.1 TerC family protein [Bacillus sp. Au-Bac7]MCM3029178.1 TerC family protein [Niallia sp. MER 6]MDL0434935.1 TerC family protein [Niallia sp. SS-2023]UPO88745.1 TerC family protein [Niallia sp. Man26]